MFADAWSFAKDTATSFVEDEALTRGAAIAFYTVTSIAPLLLIVVGIAGLVVGQDAALAGITGQFSSLAGKDAAQFLETAVLNASSSGVAGVTAALLGLATLVATASGAFGEIQSALNVIWKAEPQGSTLSRLLRARAASLGLVATLGFLLIVSLAASAAVTAFSDRLNAALPFGGAILALVNFVVSFALLPDRPLAWRDVYLGACITTLLFVCGKSLIGWYIGSSGISSVYGAAGSLVVLLLWVYYSVQVFLLGAELTKVYSNRRAGTSVRSS
jgi:membrane protein